MNPSMMEWSEPKDSAQVLFTVEKNREEWSGVEWRGLEWNGNIGFD